MPVLCKTRMSSFHSISTMYVCCCASLFFTFQVQHTCCNSHLLLVFLSPISRVVLFTNHTWLLCTYSCGKISYLLTTASMHNQRIREKLPTRIKFTNIFVSYMPFGWLYAHKFCKLFNVICFFLLLSSVFNWKTQSFFFS
jgi:hypothetical protein